jgi:hypothetical protein
VNARVMVRAIRIALFLSPFALGVYDQACATLLYDLDFTPPETGTYSTVRGSPAVVSSFDGLSDALLFHGVATYDQIQLAVGVGTPGLHLAYDVVTHGMQNSGYQFNLSLDTPLIRKVVFYSNFMGIMVVPPFNGPDTSLYSFADDTIYHLDITANIAQNFWTVSVNNTQISSRSFDASSVDAIRFWLGPNGLPGTDQPGTQVAIDNLFVETIPEPSVNALVVLGSLALMFRTRASQRPVARARSRSPTPQYSHR